jgi:glyoxylase-like metal-dependent hydrolase (beta-lactamase superfamily II)
MIKSDENTTPKRDYFEVTTGVWGLKTVFVNLYMIAITKNEWVLVDAGLNGFAEKVKNMAADLFGKNNPPNAIILTHGHFDHTGTIEELLKTWTVPVFAHELELPYLTGISSYPPPDPTVGGGLMSLMAEVYPKKPIDLGGNVHTLPNNGKVPFLPDWTYTHTPGHAPGHISLYRKKDKLLIAGDAFVTTKQESAFSVATQRKVVSGPPKYFTPNWAAAKTSVKKLRDLYPAIAATGHGKPMYGEELLKGLDNLVENFDKVAIPSQGRYVNKAAKTTKRGVVYVPPKPANRVFIASVVAITGLLTFAFIKNLK